MSTGPEVREAGNIAAMFGRISGWYDVLNRLLSFGLDQRWRQCLACTARPGSRHLLLDLAAGTLDVSLALERMYPGTRIAAMDFCLPMLTRGQRKLRTRMRDASRQTVLPAAADARRLPLADACADSVTMAFGIRNISPRTEALHEMYRVLIPGGRLCILEFGSGRRRIWKGLYNLYLHRLLPLIGRWGSGDTGAYAYLAESIAAFPLPERLNQELRSVGFDRVYHVPLTSGVVCLHVAEKPSVDTHDTA